MTSYELFNLVSLVSFENDASVTSSAFVNSRHHTFGIVLSQRQRLHFCSVPKHRKADLNKHGGGADTSNDKKEPPDFFLKEIQWFSNDNLRAKSVSVSNIGDYGVVVAENFDLFVINMRKIQPELIFDQKSISDTSWNKDVVTQVYTGPRESGRGSPSAVAWWESGDLNHMAVVGTDTGHIVVINIFTGVLMGETCVNKHIRSFEIVVDNAVDIVSLIISAEVGQWKLMLEQRSTGYMWPMEMPNFPTYLNEANEDGVLSRSRLAGLKQMSVEKIANIRQRLAEGRRMLHSRSDHELGFTTACLDPTSNVPRPECLSSQVGNTRMSVQRRDDRTFLAGYFAETSILTIHNCELEVMPQSVYKLPPSVDKIIVQGRLMLMSTLGVGSQLPQVLVCSAVHLESRINDQNFKPDSILQKFDLREDEKVVTFVSVSSDQQQVSGDSSSPKSSQSPKSSPATPVLSPATPQGPVRTKFRKLVCVSTDANGQSQKIVVAAPKPSTAKNEVDAVKTEEVAAESEVGPQDLFRQQVTERTEELKRKSNSMCDVVVVVTNKNLYLLAINQDPVDVFLASAMQCNLKEVEVLSQTFSLDRPALLELAGDLRLTENDFAGAVALYRQSGARHLKSALKLATSGNVSELLSFLQVVFTNQNLEVSHTERIHLSNLALMCHYQQILVRPFLSRTQLQERFLSWLSCNQSYDEVLATRLAVETGQWQILNSLAATRGLSAEVAESLVLWIDKFTGQSSARLDELLTGLDVTERQAIMSSFLQPGLLVSLTPNPNVGRCLAKIVQHLLVSMSGGQLEAVLHMCCPALHGLQPVLYAASIPDAGSPGLVADLRNYARAILELFITASLVTLKKKSENGSLSLKFSLSLVHRTSIKESQELNDAKLKLPVQENVMSAGFNHTVLKQKRGVTSWGCASHGVLGQGCTSSVTCSPGHVDVFTQLGVRVAAVAAGKGHSLALTDNGVYSWGSNSYGQLGVGLQPACTSKPVSVASLAGVEVVSVAAGQFHSLALDSRGLVYSWGWGVHGQLGHVDVEDVRLPMVIDVLRKYRIVQIAAGYAHTTVLTDQGEVYVFGCGLFGQIGNGENKKCLRPSKVFLDEKVKMVSAGYFHNVIVTKGNTVYCWGSNPQILRLEAQHRKKEKMTHRMEQRRKQEELENIKNLQLQEAANLNALKNISDESNQVLEDLTHLNSDPEAPILEIECPTPEKLDDVDGSSVSKSESPTVSTPSVSIPEDLPEDLHLSPQEVSIENVEGKIQSVHCGSQHSAILTKNGRLYTWGRNLEGQLGHGSRIAARSPTLVVGFHDDVICHADCGADFTICMSDSGTVFGWGSNAGGQLGNPPIEADGKSDSTKVLVMKTTKRIIKLQHGLQNSCDCPKPITGLIKTGVYSEESPNHRVTLPVSKFYQRYQLYKKFPLVEPQFRSDLLSQFLHTSIEQFHSTLDTSKLLRKCLIFENPQCAAKISLIEGKLLQAFDLTLQAIIRDEVDKTTVAQNIFKSFHLYLQEEVLHEPLEVKSLLLERLVACWQDQRFSFAKLESLLLNCADLIMLHCLVYTLFCPTPEKEQAPEGPGVRNGDSDPKLVDLFTPDFCLKIGDMFIQQMKVKEVYKKEGLDESDDKLGASKENFQGKLKNLVTEMMVQKQEIAEAEK